MNFKIPAQSITIYNALSNSQFKTANEVGTQLGIFSQTVYRAVKPLLELGVVEETGHYPKKFRINVTKNSLDTYLQIAQDKYMETFLSNDHKNIASLNPSQITFIKNREELIQKHSEDMQSALQKIDHIVSGEEVPAEIILARKQAIEKNVTLRFIVQRYDDFKKYMFSNWKKLGIQVRYTPLIDTRIIIIDTKIVYVASYNPLDNSTAHGVRYEYAPFAILMSELFEKRWNDAKEV